MLNDPSRLSTTLPLPVTRIPPIRTRIHSHNRPLPRHPRSTPHPNNRTLPLNTLPPLRLHKRLSKKLPKPRLRHHLKLRRHNRMSTQLNPLHLRPIPPIHRLSLRIQHIPTLRLLKLNRPTHHRITTGLRNTQERRRRGRGRGRGRYRRGRTPSHRNARNTNNQRTDTLHMSHQKCLRGGGYLNVT